MAASGLILAQVYYGQMIVSCRKAVAPYFKVEAFSKIRNNPLIGANLGFYGKVFINLKVLTNLVGIFCVEGKPRVV